MSEDVARFVRPSHLAGVELVAASYAGRAFPMHTHEDYVVGTVIGGAERLTLRTGEHIVGTGDVLQLHPHEAHANASVGPDPLRYLVFYLSPAAIRSQLADSGGSGELAFCSALCRDAHVASTLRHAHRTLSANDCGRLEQESALISVIQALASGKGTRGVVAHGGPGVGLARSWIDAHFRESFGLGDVAAAAGVSPYHLCRIFGDAVGLTPIAYRNQRRVDAARRALLEGRPIAEVALQVGFADQSHLTRQFQRIVGTSPARYVQQ